jgi:hypothetical protein
MEKKLSFPAPFLALGNCHSRGREKLQIPRFARDDKRQQANGAVGVPRRNVQGPLRRCDC